MFRRLVDWWRSRQEQAQLDHIGLGRRLEQVVSVLANNGIPARSIAGVFLRLDVAEKVASRLEDRPPPPRRSSPERSRGSGRRSTSSCSTARPSSSRSPASPA